MDSASGGLHQREEDQNTDISVELVFLDLILNQYTCPNEIGCWPGCKSSHGTGSLYRDTGKVMVFPAVMYRCERWTIKKAECQRIDGV